MHRLLALVFVAGCVPVTYAFTPSSNRPLSPRPENCAIDVVTSTPEKNYEELGTLEHYNGDVPKDTGKFKSAVHKQVCQAGGDAVIAISNENGRYAKGSVIKWVGEMAEPVKKVETPVQQAPDTETMPKK